MSLSTASSLDAPLGSFLPFPRLPKELRLAIWALACDPRILTMCKYFSHDKDTQYLYSSDPIPVVLHVSHESRAHSPYVASFSMGSNPRYTWVNFNLDTIQMPDYILRHIKPEEIAQIRWVVLDVVRSSDFDCHTVHEVCQMSSLEEITIYTIADLRCWIDISNRLFMFMEYEFGRREGWSRPILKVRERKTGEQLDSLNFAEKSVSLMQRRESQNGYGWEDENDWARTEPIEERHELEFAQRFE